MMARMSRSGLGRIGTHTKKKGSSKKVRRASEAYERIHDCGGITVLEFGRRGRPIMFLRCKTREIPK
jgi:hypothetical protein